MAHTNLMQTNPLDQLNAALRASLHLVSPYGAAKASPFHDPPRHFFQLGLLYHRHGSAPSSPETLGRPDNRMAARAKMPHAQGVPEIPNPRVIEARPQRIAVIGVIEAEATAPRQTVVSSVIGCCTRDSVCIAGSTDSSGANKNFRWKGVPHIFPGLDATRPRVVREVWSLAILRPARLPRRSHCLDVCG